MPFNYLQTDVKYWFKLSKHRIFPRVLLNQGGKLFVQTDTETQVLSVFRAYPYSRMTKIYDIWVRAVLTSEKAERIPGLSGDVYKNIQFFRTVDESPADFSDKQWKQKLEKLFQHEGVKVPEEGLEQKQKVSVTCKQLEGEQFQGKVEIPEEYTGESPAYSVEDIY